MVDVAFFYEHSSKYSKKKEKRKNALSLRKYKKNKHTHTQKTNLFLFLGSMLDKRRKKNNCWKKVYKFRNIINELG